MIFFDVGMCLRKYKQKTTTTKAQLKMKFLTKNQRQTIFLKPIECVLNYKFFVKKVSVLLVKTKFYTQTNQVKIKVIIAKIYKQQKSCLMLVCF